MHGYLLLPPPILRIGTYTSEDAELEPTRFNC